MTAQRTRQAATALRHAALAAWLYLLLTSHRWRAYECESYLAACARDGLVDSLSVLEWRLQALQHRAQQAALRRRLDALASGCNAATAEAA